MTECVTPDGYPYTTSYSECPPAISATTLTRPQTLTELPQTGMDGLAITLGIIGALLVAWGAFIYWMARR